ncbi:uncharacterized protein DUF4178 [Rhodobacter viridis]|uniref:Uncharacterized protein DUF4178 n=1 Tax=Rhodobacter viridis TaxID=1054202 RepID=A0A318TNY7_9RHOB|nr:DUF4178 domain-containing protein [Rhodobacter viridis]PYF06572.1 uncharacterized protein DUF4178 [Rhodobacter viridis]
MSKVNCPSCGADVGGGLGAVRMIACPYCGTTSLLKGGQVFDAGATGEMHTAPSLLQLHQTARIGADRWTPLGHARFSYGRGEWDEFWCESAQGKGAWISIDEGDVVVQRPMPAGWGQRIRKVPVLGEVLHIDGKAYRVTETEDARCIALRGSFPEELSLGETYRFFNAAGPGGQLLSGESGPQGWSWFLGDWVDPFEVTPA